MYNRSGIEELRLLVNNFNSCREDAISNYSISDLLAIHKAWQASKWDIYPDEWSPEQIQATIKDGTPPTFEGLIMIKLIVSNGGYAEMGQVAKMFWVNYSSINEHYTDAIKDLANDLLEFYIKVDLTPVSQWDKPKCHAYVQENYLHCGQCGAKIREEVDPDEFKDFVLNLSKADADMIPDELDRWWPWITFYEVMKISPLEIITIEENFEVIITSFADSRFLSTMEKDKFLKFRDVDCELIARYKGILSIELKA